MAGPWRIWNCLNLQSPTHAISPHFPFSFHCFLFSRFSPFCLSFLLEIWIVYLGVGALDCISRIWCYIYTFLGLGSQQIKYSGVVGHPWISARTAHYQAIYPENPASSSVIQCESMEDLPFRTQGKKKKLPRTPGSLDRSLWLAAAYEAQRYATHCAAKFSIPQPGRVRGPCSARGLAHAN